MYLTLVYWILIIAYIALFLQLFSTIFYTKRIHFTMIGGKLKNIQIENLIWLIYFFISIAAIVSNYFETNYIKYKNINDFKHYKTINITIFTIAFFIYLYFVYINYKNISTLKKNASKQKVLNSNINFIASLLFLIGGILYLYTESKSLNTEDEIAI